MIPKDHFTGYIEKARKAAYELGYAVAVHGSMERDLDLVAIPWTVEACDTETLVKAIIQAVDGYIKPEIQAKKPHGRTAYVVFLLTGSYIDLSVMPRLELERPKAPDNVSGYADLEWLRSIL